MVSSSPRLRIRMCGVRRQAMQERSLDKRVDLVEKKMGALETLPDRVTRVELQLVHLRDEIRSGDEETRRVLRDEIRSGDDETRRYMRVLHEDVIARLATIQEGKRPRKKR